MRKKITAKIYKFVSMKPVYVNIHTHRPRGCGIELRTAGIHPWDAGREDVAGIVPLPDEVQAVGEIGLDFVRGPAPAVQFAAFRAQLRIARERGLPVVLHCVKAFEAVMRCLAECTPRAVIFHGFIGSPEQARQALRRGYCLSFGERTFRSPRTMAAMRETPLSQLFLETDESDTPIEAIYARAAEALGTSVVELQRVTTKNYERIFCNG